MVAKGETQSKSIFLKLSNKHLNAEMKSLRKGQVKSTEEIQEKDSGILKQMCGYLGDSKDNQHIERSLKYLRTASTTLQGK